LLLTCQIACLYSMPELSTMIEEICPESSCEEPASGLGQVPLDIPSDSTSVTPDGFVVKHVIEQGTGEKVALHSRCLGKLTCVVYESSICLCQCHGNRLWWAVQFTVVGIEEPRMLMHAHACWRLQCTMWESSYQVGKCSWTPSRTARHESQSRWWQGEVSTILPP